MQRRHILKLVKSIFVPLFDFDFPFCNAALQVNDLRKELDCRALSSKGLKSQLIARLTKQLKVEEQLEESKEPEKPEIKPPEEEEPPRTEEDKEVREAFRRLTALSRDKKFAMTKRRPPSLAGGGKEEARGAGAPAPRTALHPPR